MMNNNIVKFLFKTVKFLLITFALIVVGVVLIQRVFNNNVSIFGYRIFTVVTGSMAPEYNVFDVIISKTVDPKTLKVGDDVVYMGDKGSFTGKIVTHRIIEIKNESNELQFYTKGIANSGVDPVVDADQIYGIVISKSYVLSFASKVVSHPIGFLLLVMIPASILVGAEIFERFDKKEEEEN